jgi:hypothetical protein
LQRRPPRIGGALLIDGGLTTAATKAQFDFLMEIIRTVLARLLGRMTDDYEAVFAGCRQSEGHGTRKI